MTESKVSSPARARGRDGRFLPATQNRPSAAFPPADAGGTSRGSAQTAFGAAESSQPSGSLRPQGRGLVEDAKAIAGTEWAIVRTWPLESGLAWLAERMKG